MAKRWYEIPGWCSSEVTHLYDEAVANAKDGDIFVEIGCYLGRSTQYMIERIEESGKKIFFDVIDDWEEDLGLGENKSFSEFLKNVETERIRNIIRKDSLTACSRYKEKQIKFLFLDTTHAYDHVKKEILSWKPKVNNTISGHDYNQEECKRAVDEIFKNISVRKINNGKFELSSWSYTFLAHLNRDRFKKVFPVFFCSISYSRIHVCCCVFCLTSRN
jgi:hypothetical protein